MPMGHMSVLVLDLVQRTGTIEPIVEVRVKVVSLVCEHRTERTTIGREPSVPFVHVVAVGDCGGDGAVRVRRNTVRI
jgi:hypothetical protein